MILVSINDISKLIISRNDTIKKAMETIDRSYRGIALITDQEFRLAGTVTDGDIRRAILQGVSVEESIEKVMNANFTFVTKNYTNRLIENIFTQKGIYQIPVLDDEMRVLDIVFYQDFYRTEIKDNWVVIMAGGVGARLMPLTQDMPKPMLKVGAKPILETIIEQVKSYGFKNVVLCVNYKADIIESYFQDGSDFGVNITYIKEHKRLGTAGAIKMAEKHLTAPFFVVNGDILTKLNFEQFIGYHTKQDNVITVGAKNYEFQVPYGVLSIQDQNLTDIKEKPLFHYFINGGLYCLRPSVIEYIPKDEYFDITQLIDICLKDGLKVGTFPITEYWMDIGQMDQYNQANVDYTNLFRGELNADEE